MKKHKKRRNPRTVARPRRIRVITLTVAVGLIVIAAITVVSKQLTNSRTSAKTVTASTTPKYVTVKVAGRDVQIDGQTGQVKPMTAQKAQEIADLLKARLNKSTDGLPEVHNPDGSVSVDLQGRAQNVLLARTNDDGLVEHACVDEPLAAAQFLGIDPKLVGVEAPQRPNGSTTFRTPPKKSIQ